MRKERASDICCYYASSKNPYGDISINLLTDKMICVSNTSRKPFNKFGVIHSLCMALKNEKDRSGWSFFIAEH